VTWKALHHPNVLPLLGVTMDARHFAMASEWMVNGNINEFIEAYRDANRPELVGFHSGCWSRPSLTISSGSSKTSLVGWYICTVRQWYTEI